MSKTHLVGTIQTLLGEVYILNCFMKMSGIGHYKIFISILFEGEQSLIVEGSNDSELYDKVYAEENASDILMDEAQGVIAHAVNFYINSL